MEMVISPYWNILRTTFFFLDIPKHFHNFTANSLNKYKNMLQSSRTDDTDFYRGLSCNLG